jgi:hypothetical protein
MIKETIQESYRDFLKMTLIAPGDLKALVKWLDKPENWEAAAKAIGLGKGDEKELVDFVKAHREFDDWSWNDVKDAIDKANEMNLMESFNKKLNKGKK